MGQEALDHISYLYVYLDLPTMQKMFAVFDMKSVCLTRSKKETHTWKVYEGLSTSQPPFHHTRTRPIKTRGRAMATSRTRLTKSSFEPCTGSIPGGDTWDGQKLGGVTGEAGFTQRSWFMSRVRMRGSEGECEVRCQTKEQEDLGRNETVHGNLNHDVEDLEVKSREHRNVRIRRI